MATDFNPNVITGLASGMDTKNLVEQLVAAQRKKVEPVIARKETKKIELDTWKQVESYIKTVGTAADSISARSVWDGQIVESSNPEVVGASASSGAKSGKHTIVVDKLALSHQIASQSYERKDSPIGRGTVRLSIGDDREFEIVIDDRNETLQGFADSINALDADVVASIIKTGNEQRPYQVVLTSRKTGLDGKITIAVELEGEGEYPTFDPFYLQPGKWSGAALDRAGDGHPAETGASTSVPELIGEYRGDKPIELTFTAVGTGIVGTSENLKLRWDDNTGRHGYLELGSFHYTPGNPIDIVDGIQLKMSEGELIVNDTFTATAKNQESVLYWWKNEGERAPRISQPGSWMRQKTEGGPIVKGKYDSDEDDFFKLTVVGSGQVGRAENLQIRYESENGFKGTVFVGDGYVPGSVLSLGKGLEFSLNAGLLEDGDFATFAYEADPTADYWWLEEEERHGGGQIVDLTDWTKPEDGEKGLAVSDIKRPAESRTSTAEKTIVGKYDGYESKLYTFTALKNGSVGITRDLKIQWEDGKGKSGVLDIGGNSYQTGQPLEFDSGLSLVLEKGRVFEKDSFTFRTFSPVIQPPQNAEIRLGATELGGGLLVTNPTNELKDVIDGVTLNLVTADKKPVTISIREDTEKALTGITEFVRAYNEMLVFFQEMTKFDKNTGESGPLQGDRKLPTIQREMSRIFIDTVWGLEKNKNMLISIGLKMNKEGFIDADEKKLLQAVEEDLSTVANLFRSYGSSDNSGIVYLGSSEHSRTSGPDGYDIDVTAVATNGIYSTKPQSGKIQVTDANKAEYLIINGRESDAINLETGRYSIEEIAEDLKKKIVDDKKLGNMKVEIAAKDGILSIRSNVTGSKSSVRVRVENPIDNYNHFLLNGEGQDGRDVQGTINGVDMQGSGQVLSGVEGTDFQDLKLFVSLAANQIGTGPEGNMVFTKGVATKAKEYIDAILKPETGALGIYTKTVKEQLDGYEKEVKKLEERISKKREKLTEKFARMEAKLGQLKSEQNYMTRELAKLG